jgi:sulfite reductase (NADPH) hemoprotein beta-component
MSKSAPQISVLTANRLGDGIVVFLDFEGAWSENLAEAVVAHSPDEVRALEDRGAYDAARNLVVEPYLVVVHEADGRLTPIRYRERVRVLGPSILADVPGYTPAPLPSPRSSRGEGQGEGQPHTPAQAPAPHPSPLVVPEARLRHDASGERGPREHLTQAA